MIKINKALLVDEHYHAYMQMVELSVRRTRLETFANDDYIFRLALVMRYLSPVLRGELPRRLNFTVSAITRSQDGRSLAEQSATWKDCWGGISSLLVNEAIDPPVIVITGGIWFFRDLAERIRPLGPVLLEHDRFASRASVALQFFILCLNRKASPGVVFLLAADEPCESTRQEIATDLYLTLWTASPAVMQGRIALSEVQLDCSFRQYIDDGL